MFITVLCLLTFFGHSSSLTSVKSMFWNDDGMTLRKNVTEDMVPKKVYPFMAFLIRYDLHSCSGSIVSLNATLSTATCINAKMSITIWAGTNRLLQKEDMQPPTQKRVVAKVYVYDPDDVDTHDIGIAFTSQPWTRTPYVKPVAIWIQATLLHFEYLEPATVIGWGYGGYNITNRVLRRHFIMIGSNVMCPLTYLQLHRNIMCSNEGMYQTVCKGDEGGPVVAYYPLLGFVVLAVVKGKVPTGYAKEPPAVALDPTCFVPTVSSMYTYVGFYRDWLFSLLSEKDLYESWKPYIGGNSKKKIHDQKEKQEPVRGRHSPTRSTGAIVFTSQHLLLTALCLLLPSKRCGCPPCELVVVPPD